MKPLHEQFIQKIRNRAWLQNLINRKCTSPCFFNISLIKQHFSGILSFRNLFIRINIELLHFCQNIVNLGPLLSICFLLRLGYLFSNSTVSCSCRLKKLNHIGLNFDSKRVNTLYFIEKHARVKLPNNIHNQINFPTSFRRKDFVSLQVTDLYRLFKSTPCA